MLSIHITNQIHSSLEKIIPRKNYKISYDRITGTPIISWNINVNHNVVFDTLKNITGINRDFIILRKEC